MGWSGRGSRDGKGKAEAGSQWSSKRRTNDDSWYESAAWTDSSWQGVSYDAADAAVSSALPMSLAAQWRYYTRVLRVHAPEEKIFDPRRQVRLGDHLFVRFAWDLCEQHGIVHSIAGEESQTRRREEPSVVFYSESASQLQRVSLSQFMKGGDLFRATYPLWACRCELPSVSTAKPRVVEESLLYAESPEVVAKRAGSAQKSSWESTWSQAPDLEFCLEMKAIDGKPAFELHSRKSISELVVSPIGMTFHSTRSPSEQLFGSSGKGNSSPPGFATASRGWSGAPPANPAGSQVLAASDFEAFQQQKHGDQYSAQHAWSGFSPQAFAGMQPVGNFNPDAAVFVPGLGEKNWDGIYQ